MKSHSIAGASQIIRFNAPFYITAALTVAAGIVVLRRWPAGSTEHLAGLAIVAPAAFWLIASIAASWLVYDRSGLYSWGWVPDALGARPHRWVNVHAGLDQSTAILRVLLPGSEGQSLEIFDPRDMTEGSIRRARAAVSDPHGDAGRAQAPLDTLPFADRSVDAVFLLFAAHEIRQGRRRVAFLTEVARVLDGGGRILMVEHLRDWRNAIAFGPGALHFFSRAEWLRNARAAGLIVEREWTQAILVRCFLLGRAPG